MLKDDAAKSSSECTSVLIICRAVNSKLTFSSHTSLRLWVRYSQIFACSIGKEVSTCNHAANKKCTQLFK